jgi:hypothetical protein
MRIAVLIAGSLLVAGCSGAGDSHAGHSPTSSAASPGTSSGTSSKAVPSASKPQGPSAAPAPGAAISDVIAWIEAAHPADPARYHSAVREGVTTALGSDLAFAVNAGPGGPILCATDAKHTGGALACLVNLTNPPPRPETAYGEWKGGWVDFAGTTLQIGSARGDPGPFVNGNGTDLASGDSLSYDDYRCRADQAGLYCVNYARQSAARFSAAGIDPFGCLRSVPPPDGVGAAFGC